MDNSLIETLRQKLDELNGRLGPSQRHETLQVPREQRDQVFDELARRLEGNYPFGHPSYAGQMLKPPLPEAWMAYALAMSINPNNHALDGGPPTSEMEKQAVRELAAMAGLPGATLGHLTGGGTMANMEGLWVARNLHPGRPVAFSDKAHYTHRRMCELLGLEHQTIPTDLYGRMDPGELERLDPQPGTVVVTMGSTGLGAIDPLHHILPVARGMDARVHVDAAYGGYYALLAGSDILASAPWSVLGEVDSLVIDPHKHGLQPYGCGCILFRDPSVGRFYRHDSPYTYFTSDELHLGEISLECSRPGAAAAALWATMQLLPLHPDTGLGAVLRSCRRAARDLYDRLDGSPSFRPLLSPELDIVNYFPEPAPGAKTTSGVSRLSQQVFQAGMQESGSPVYLSINRVDSEKLTALHPDIQADTGETDVLRSVLMKPEHEPFARELMRRLEYYAGAGA